MARGRKNLSATSYEPRATSYNAFMPEHIVTEPQNKERLDHLLNDILSAQENPPSRSLVRKWIDEGCVRLNGEPVTKAGHKLKSGDQLEWDAPEIKILEITAEDIALDIVYEDSDLLVINKPVGMVVHPGAGHGSGTLVNALLHHCTDLSGIGGVERPGIVHRLDKDTSGLLAVAKNDLAHHALQKQLQARVMKRCYYAIAEQGFGADSGTIEAPLDRHPVERQRMAVVEGGKFARTHWSVQQRFEGYTWLALELDTGRTHQIRVHLRHIHHPIVGDNVYGTKRKHPFKVERPMLHAYKLSFRHPRTDVEISLEAPLPEDFSRIVEILSKKQRS